MIKINCFIDPIFLAVKEASLYSEEVFPIFSKFFKKIRSLEKKLEQNLEKKLDGDRFFKFNISQELLLECYNHSPYQINQVRGKKAWNKWYKGFLQQLFQIYRNKKCEDIIQNPENKFEFSNINVPLSIMEKWNKFINNCVKCKNSEVPCHQNVELLTLQEFGSTLAYGKKLFYGNKYNIYQWLKQKFNQECKSLGIKIYFDTPSVSQINPNNKKKGNWEHHHDNAILREVDKLINCKYIDKIMPGGHDAKCKIDKIFYRPEKSLNLLEIYLNGEEKTEIFYLYTTAEDEDQIEPILNEIWKFIPSLNLC